MTTIKIELDTLTAHKLAALYTAIHDHVSKLDVVTQILEAGYANCGKTEFDALIIEAQLAHIA